MTKMTSDITHILRAAFATIEKVDIDGPVYRGLVAILDRADNDALKAVHAAKIPFASSLALNRMIRRGIV
jgi:hypothetical protein